MVAARSAAEMPVVVPCRASTLTVNAVRWASVLADTMSGRSSWSARSGMRGTQITPEVWARKKAIVLGGGRLGRHHQVALVLAVLVVDHHDHAARGRWRRWPPRPSRRRIRPPPPRRRSSPERSTDTSRPRHRSGHGRRPGPGEQRAPVVARRTGPGPGRARSGRPARPRGSRGPPRRPLPPAPGARPGRPRSSSTSPRSPDSSTAGWTRAASGAWPSTTRSGWRSGARVEPGGQLGVVGPHRARPDQHGVGAGPQPVHVGPGRRRR